MERIGVGFSGGMSPQDIVECVRVAEDLGDESAWVAEGHGGGQVSVRTACPVAAGEVTRAPSIPSGPATAGATPETASASFRMRSTGPAAASGR